MAYLETLEHLAILSRKDPAVVEADPFAQLIMEKATELCISAAGIPTPDWETDPTLVPGRVRTICLFVAFRTYNNPKSIINTGVGPISESVLAQHAAAMTLTEAERDELEAIGEENGVGGLWVLQTTGGPETVMDTVFLPDNSPTDWWIPYFAEGDVGTEWETEGAPAEGGSSEVSLAAFNALEAQVAALAGTVSTGDAALDTRLDVAETDITTLESTTAGLDTRLDVAETDITTLESTTAGLDTRLDAAEADLLTKAETSDLGPQIHLGDTPPESGSGELWADTDPD
jgi:hypothetical protein